MSFLFDTEEEQEARRNPGRSRSSAALGRAVGTDTEIALGTRSLLGIFFGLVLVCAVFFGLGYSVGRGSGTRAAAPAPADTTASTTDSHTPKPSPEQTLTPVESPATGTDQDNGATSLPPDSPPPQPSGTQTQPQGRTPAPLVSSPASSPGTVSSATPRTPVPLTPKPAPVMQPAPATAAASFMVQVAAVRIQQDAEILVDALKKHGYTAVVRNEPQDQLLHIQLGPFTSRADANAMRAKLLADGYNAVIK
jgi:cell division septation protein DedD